MKTIKVKLPKQRRKNFQALADFLLGVKDEEFNMRMYRSQLREDSPQGSLSDTPP